jgi:hypothetical protein
VYMRAMTKQQISPDHGVELVSSVSMTRYITYFLSLNEFEFAVLRREGGASSCHGGGRFLINRPHRGRLSPLPSLTFKWVLLNIQRVLNIQRGPRAGATWRRSTSGTSRRLCSRSPPSCTTTPRTSRRSTCASTTTARHVPPWTCSCRAWCVRGIMQHASYSDLFVCESDG